MRNCVLLALIFVVLFGGFSSASATHPLSEYKKARLPPLGLDIFIFTFSALKVSNFLDILKHLQKLLVGLSPMWSLLLLSGCGHRSSSLRQVQIIQRAHVCFALFWGLFIGGWRLSLALLGS